MQDDDGITLVSSVVAPQFETGRLELTKVSDARALARLLARVSCNYHAHPSTVEALRELCPSLPPAERRFWRGEGLALAARPKGGARKGEARNVDASVSLGDLEFVLYRWMPEGVQQSAKPRKRRTR